MDTTQLVIAGVTGLAGAVLGSGGATAVLTAVFKHRLDSKQQTHDHSMATITRLEARIVALEEQNQECLEAHARTREALGEMRGRVARLERDTRA